MFELIVQSSAKSIIVEPLRAIRGDVEPKFITATLSPGVGEAGNVPVTAEALIICK